MTKRTCHMERRQDSYSLAKLVGLDWPHLRIWSGPPTLRTSDTMAGYAIGPFPELMLGSLFLYPVKRKSLPSSPSTFLKVTAHWLLWPPCLVHPPLTSTLARESTPTLSLYLWLIQPQHPSSLRTFTHFSDPVHLSLLPRDLSHPPTA